MIIPNPDFFHPGSRGQKSTGSGSYCLLTGEHANRRTRDGAPPPGHHDADPGQPAAQADSPHHPAPTPVPGGAGDLFHEEGTARAGGWGGGGRGAKRARLALF
jgi:hypothetical protein